MVAGRRLDFHVWQFFNTVWVLEVAWSEFAGDELSPKSNQRKHLLLVHSQSGTSSHSMGPLTLTPELSIKQPARTGAAPHILTKVRQHPRAPVRVGLCASVCWWRLGERWRQRFRLVRIGGLAHEYLRLGHLGAMPAMLARLRTPGLA